VPTVPEIKTMSNLTATIDALLNLLAAGDKSVLPVLEDAVRELPVAGKARAFVVTAKAHRHLGVDYPEKIEPGAYAIVTPGKSVRLFGVEYSGRYDRTFAIGDTVAYDSWNMTYCGEIKSIGPSGTVTVTKGRREGTKRLDLHVFNWRNRTLDLAAIDARNADVMMSC